MTNLEPVTLGYIIDQERPVIPYWKQVTNAMCSESHAHPRGQFIFSSKGLTRVITKTGHYLVPSSQAFWCPPNQEHEVIFLGAVDIANLFIDPAWTQLLPKEQQVLSVSPLAQQLILKAVLIGEEYPPEGKERRLMEVIIDEISTLTPSPLTLPWSEHPKIHGIISSLLKDPTNTNSIEQWASLVYSTPRTLARIFQKEVNMTFSNWRMQARLFYALEQLHTGKSVTLIALELSYSTPSAFISAFKKVLGRSPLDYISRTES